MNRDLKVFMRESAKNPEIISVPGPDSLKGPDGNPVMLEIKALSNHQIKKINDMYTKKTMVTDKKGRPYIRNGEVAFKVEGDAYKATGHILAEALVYPDLKNPELMKFFDCHDISEMAEKVFSRSDEWLHVNNAVMAVLGLGGEVDAEELAEELEEDIEDLKK